MDTDKAYLLGALVGGGTIGTDTVSIEFPYRQWGRSYKSPTRATEIFESIVNHVQPKLKQIYDIDSFPKYHPEWQIVCTNLSEKLKKDLLSYGITPSGILREHASIKALLKEMDLVCKSEFVAGLADVIGSVQPTHRRFDMRHTIISFEILGENFNLVIELCHLLREMGCPCDQILWEHPNMHCGYDPWDDEWINKGNKLRVLTWEYILRASFAFGPKQKGAISLAEIEKHVAGRITINRFCPNKKYNFKGIKTIHTQEFHTRLLERVRGHFIHYTHICAAMGCPYAPLDLLSKKLKEAGDIINPFVVHKLSEYSKIMKIINQNLMLSSRKYKIVKVHLNQLLKRDDDDLLFGKGPRTGYRAGFIKQAVNEIVKYDLGIPRRKSVAGLTERSEILNQFAKQYPKKIETIEIHVPDLLTPLIVTDYKCATLIGPENPEVYDDLIERPVSPLSGLRIRPVREEDLCRGQRLL